MKKKEKSKKNVFGLVSKLGNLIKIGGGANSNTDNIDTSAGENEIPKKNFHIHISEDDQEQIELGDDDEEEEEEDENEQEAKIDKKENKESENKIIIETKKEDNNNSDEKNLENINNMQNKSEPNSKGEKKEENNIKNNIENNNEKNNSYIEEEKNETKKIIINDYKNKDNINITIKEDSKIQVNEIKIKEEVENIKEEDLEEDINEVCHLYLKKGNDFNSKEIYCIPITQIKNRKKKSIFQKMNVFKKSKNEIINYKIFIEENCIYFAKDIIIDKKNDALRRIYKIYNIRNISNYIANKDLTSDKYKIIFEMMNKKLINKSKEYFIDVKYFKEFNDAINKKLKIYGDKFFKK